MGPFIFFLIIWICSTAFGVFMTHPFFEDIPLIRLGVITCAICWVVSFIITLLVYIKILGNRGASYPGGPATYEKGEDKIPGMIRFPDRYLLFLPNQYDVIDKDLEIKYKDIDNVSFGDVTRELVIQEKKGRKYRFRVGDRAKWKRYIELRLARLAKANETKK